MNRIEIVTRIEAPPEICFDLARDIDFHIRSMGETEEQAVDGVVTGLIEPGETVTFSGRHFWLTHEHTSKITQFERPHHFRDEMVRGRFRLFVHDHYFEVDGNGTVMKDVIVFESPYGPIGTTFDHLVLKRYLKHLIESRNRKLKTEAERRSGKTV